MPAVTQGGPVCRKGFGCRCLHSDVDGINENGPYQQHRCKTKQTSQGESEYHLPSASKEGNHQSRKERSNLDSSDALPPVAVKRILHSNEQRPRQNDLSRTRHHVAKNNARCECRQQQTDEPSRNKSHTYLP